MNKNKTIDRLKLRLVNVNNELYIYFLIFGNYKFNELTISYHLDYIQRLFDLKDKTNIALMKFQIPILYEFHLKQSKNML